ncbi:MAG: heme-binding protein [Cyclobacteriaceae bacterium]|nr:heme-binding protein [Cyclobacteriaceae bacterium]
MIALNKVSAHEARQLMDVALAEAEKIGKQLVVSVCGPETELLAFLRMDGANQASATIAQNKAYTAAKDRKSTRMLGQYMKEKERQVGFWGDPRITGFGGGLPIVINGQVIGGIGISGLSEAEDERIAAVAIRAVFPQAEL